MQHEKCNFMAFPNSNDKCCCLESESAFVLSVSTGVCKELKEHTSFCLRTLAVADLTGTLCHHLQAVNKKRDGLCVSDIKKLTTVVSSLIQLNGRKEGLI